jgi:hypothetical protein
MLCPYIVFTSFYFRLRARVCLGCLGCRLRITVIYFRGAFIRLLSSRDMVYVVHLSLIYFNLLAHICLF